MHLLSEIEQIATQIKNLYDYDTPLASITKNAPVRSNFQVLNNTSGKQLSSSTPSSPLHQSFADQQIEDEDTFLSQTKRLFIERIHEYNDLIGGGGAKRVQQSQKQSSVQERKFSNFSLSQLFKSLEEKRAQLQRLKQLISSLYSIAELKKALSPKQGERVIWQLKKYLQIFQQEKQIFLAIVSVIKERCRLPEQERIYNMLERIIDCAEKCFFYCKNEENTYKRGTYSQGIYQKHSAQRLRIDQHQQNTSRLEKLLEVSAKEQSHSLPIVQAKRQILFKILRAICDLSLTAPEALQMQSEIEQKHLLALLEQERLQHNLDSYLRQQYDKNQWNNLKEAVFKRRINERNEQKNTSIESNLTREHVVRHVGDAGKLTNFHIVLNASNLKPLLKQIDPQRFQNDQSTTTTTQKYKSKIQARPNIRDSLQAIAKSANSSPQSSAIITSRDRLGEIDAQRSEISLLLASPSIKRPQQEIERIIDESFEISRTSNRRNDKQQQLSPPPELAQRLQNSHYWRQKMAKEKQQKRFNKHQISQPVKENVILPQESNDLLLQQGQQSESKTLHGGSTRILSVRGEQRSCDDLLTDTVMTSEQLVLPAEKSKLIIKVPPKIELLTATQQMDIMDKQQESDQISLRRAQILDKQFKRRLPHFLHFGGSRICIRINSENRHMLLQNNSFYARQNQRISGDKGLLQESSRNYPSVVSRSADIDALDPLTSPQMLSALDLQTDYDDIVTKNILQSQENINYA